MSGPPQGGPQPAGKLDLFTGICARGLDNSRASARLLGLTAGSLHSASFEAVWGAKRREKISLGGEC
jgi:hypothetical protein